jgi:integrase
VDLRRHYSSQKISFSLRTSSKLTAAARANQAVCKLDEYWFHLRSQDVELPGKHLLRTSLHKSADAPESVAVNEDALKLSEGVLLYLKLKGTDKSKSFHRAAERACGYVIDTCGDKALAEYTKSDANAFRDAMIERGLAGSSITRVFGTVRSVFNFASSETGLLLTNPFASVYYDRSAGVSDRKPIPIEQILEVQRRCYDTDDELRWLVAIVSDTGMRLAEAAGLIRDDIQEDQDGKLVARVCPHPWRGLKTKGSERLVPLAGAAEWAGQRILEERQPSEFAFPRYN